ncbi:putative ferric reductase [Paenibacillus sp. PastF-1]|nr:putative ferric reductase [Paenibacillus sp. PastF-2]MDF9846516.1 putative ferric reductase [Paenibacillus sp. PastM-2]MDF9853136.1 putative ferric reductase [Paenibacillus sp. PastF-1]MDH6478360.1 putative ferric reductase [Paenibacillus sp. PastH-2]MDH6506142.1 putative ferric reductase [Paenibacillus sp. PastM-3]
MRLVRVNKQSLVVQSTVMLTAALPGPLCGSLLSNLSGGSLAFFSLTLQQILADRSEYIEQRRVSFKRGHTMLGA